MYLNISLIYWGSSPLRDLYTITAIFNNIIFFSGIHPSIINNDLEFVLTSLIFKSILADRFWSFSSLSISEHLPQTVTEYNRLERIYEI